MKKLKLLFGVHNHQPVGNFDHVFEEVFRKCYFPYFEVLKQFKHLKTSAHFSGPLLDWLRAHQPRYLLEIRNLVEAGQLEILSGGYYEPILPSLPEKDAIGQIRMMNAFIENEFGQTPRGMWLAERIWSPSLPKVIAEAGLQFTIVDDTHFYYSGLEENEISGYFITENQGYSLKIFPISKTLRYSIPFELPDKTQEHLRRWHEAGVDAVTYADDGEKFGSWPETYEWVYEKNYLRNLFAMLESSMDWLETVTFGDYIQGAPPLGRVYLPMASYDEMMEWALPHSAALHFENLKQQMEKAGLDVNHSRRFLRGGHWDNFLTKYEESNNMHKKMLYVSRKVHQMSPDLQESSGALRELYQGQCNCAQWHGLFGGLYLNYLRHALYQHLIAAENIADDHLLGESRGWSVDCRDVNFDGRDELVISNPIMSACFAPGQGGSLYELDYRPACFNLSNVLRRRPEVYHQTIRDASGPEAAGEGQPHSIHDRVRFKEEGLEKKLIYDTGPRYSFMDHFFTNGTEFDDFKYNRFVECGDFLNQPYEVLKQRREVKGPDRTLVLGRRGRVRQGEQDIPVSVEKSFLFSEGLAEINARYRITNGGETSLKGLWGCEFNFTLLAGDAADRTYRFSDEKTPPARLGAQGVVPDAPSIALRDGFFRFELQLEFSPSAQLWFLPVETVSQSEDGFESVYQGSCILALWPLDLHPEKTVEFQIALRLKGL